jgi:predicted dehydrogenase
MSSPGIVTGDAGVSPRSRGYPNAFRTRIASSYAAVARARGGEAPGADYPTLDDGCRSVALVEAVLRSARERRWVPIA